MNRLKRLWHNFSSVLPEYDRRNRQEWLYWGTRRAERWMRAFGYGFLEKQKPDNLEDCENAKGQVFPEDPKGLQQ